MFEDFFVIPIMFSSIIQYYPVLSYVPVARRSLILQFDLIFFLVLLRTKNFVARSCSFVRLEFNVTRYVNVARTNEEVIMTEGLYEKFQNEI